MTERKRKTAPIPDDMQFWTIDDLKAAGIVTSTTDLWVKQKDYGFPRGVVLGGKRRHFRLSDIRQWLASREGEESRVAPPPR